MASSTLLHPFHFASTRAISSLLPSVLNSSRISFPLKNGSFKLRNAPTFTLKACSARESKAVEVTKATWDKMIMKSETPVLVEFYSEWCGPCNMFHKIIDEIAEDYAGRLSCFRLNMDNDGGIAECYGICIPPAVLLFKNGEKRVTVAGSKPKDLYIAAIEEVLKS